MDDEANRCWCGSTLKGKPHNCVGTQGRVEGLLAENVNLREAIRGEREKNGVLSIWLKEEGDKVKALELQLRDCANALGLALTHGHPPSDPQLRAKFERGWAIYRKLSEQGLFIEKPKCDHDWQPYVLGTDIQCTKCKTLKAPESFKRP